MKNDIASPSNIWCIVAFGLASQGIKMPRTVLLTLFAMLCCPVAHSQSKRSDYTADYDLIYA